MWSTRFARVASEFTVHFHSRSEWTTFNCG